ncbi:MAG: hypothetical protein ACYTKD_14130 [Planctomycetota bacterium]|jgi:hypothetical protein
MVGAWVAFLAWVVTAVLHIGLGSVALAGERKLEDARLGSLKVSCVAGAFPLLALVVFFLVFVVGGGSSVAQMSAPNMWLLWNDLFGLLFVGTSAALIAAIVAACLPPYPPGHRASFAGRIVGIAACGLAWYHVAVRVPSA